jgi:hypothetical protein
MRSALAAAAVVVLAGCGRHEAARTLDATAVQHEVRAYAVDTYPGRTVGAVKCPPHEAIAANRRFVCRATVASEPVRIQVTEIDDVGDHVTFIPLDAIVDVPAATAAIAGQVAPAFTGTVTIDCGPAPIVVVQPGHTFPCTGTDPLGHTHPITAAVQDLAGNVLAAVVAPPTG